MIKDRIAQIIKDECLTNVEFAEKIGISTSSLSHILKERNKPSLEVVMRIHKACPHISLNWLLYGEGDMEDPKVKDSEQNLFAQPDENAETADENAFRFDFRKENGEEQYSQQPKEPVREEIKYIEKPAPKIVEIRIFFDNGTYQIFRPDNS